MPVYPVVARAAFLTFFSGSADVVLDFFPFSLLPFLPSRSGGVAVLDAVDVGLPVRPPLRLKLFVAPVSSSLSFLVMTGLCWIMPILAAFFWAAAARAMISWYDPFLNALAGAGAGAGAVVVAGSSRGLALAER